ncbi:hypothetical protein VAPA_1c46910 [Variovorax paradoxus B4]|uniref:Uncharacterized protein n=1 Tax=Variovorax paradoxus B4 TaxID=1246301 RepID=T1XGR9_VARPD|nr:hypothetical protein VAPA_1c46910 [Variovorax paradoxus B4]
MTIYSGVRTVPGAILRDHAGIERQLSSATNFRFAPIPPDRIVPLHERLVLAEFRLEATSFLIPQVGAVGSARVAFARQERKHRTRQSRWHRL